MYLLNHIYFILNSLHDKIHEYGFSSFLQSKDFGAKGAAMVIQEKNYKDPYLELNKLWNEYTDWREKKIRESNRKKK